MNQDADGYQDLKMQQRQTAHKLWIAIFYRVLIRKQQKSLPLITLRLKTCRSLA